MSQLISFINTNSGSEGGCKTAIAPVVFQYSASHVAPDGSTPIVAADLAAGAQAYYGGQLIAVGCHDVELTLIYLTGDDCDSCTSEALVEAAPQKIIIPANSSFSLPDGFWQYAEYVLIDDAGLPVDLVGTQTETVRIYSAYKPACSTCAVLAV